MSRVAKIPITIPTGVDVRLNHQEIVVKGDKGELTYTIHEDVVATQRKASLFFCPRKASAVKEAWAQAGTSRALVNNMVIGVRKGFTKQLELKGVGYRATVKGNIVTLNLGLSHPVKHELPVGVKVECPSQTEVVVSGCDKQRVGQVAADIRSYCEPEPYKGRGIRYLGEHIRTKDAKKR
jgi:large subunit ribosomal protein L6